MLWRNVKKKERENWYAVPAPALYDAKEAMAWCRAQTSMARFYTHYTNTRWWFESEKDAMHFCMRWADSQSERQNAVKHLNRLNRTTSTGPR